MKWFKKIKERKQQKEDMRDKLFHDLCDTKLSVSTYNFLMLKHEFFHFSDKDWIIFNVRNSWETLNLSDCSYPYIEIKLKIRSIEDDPRMSLELDFNAIKFEQLIDVNKYISLNEQINDEMKKDNNED